MELFDYHLGIKYLKVLRKFAIFFPHQPSLAQREKAAAPKPNGRRRAVAASYGKASQSKARWV